jgi:ABC-2 type transport system permease protein
VTETLVIAKRELLERVRTKWFVVVTLLGPLLMIAMLVIPAAIASRGAAGAKIAIADDSGTLAPVLVAALSDKKFDFEPSVVPAGVTDDELRGRIARREISGFLRIPKDVLDTGAVTYQGDNASNQTVDAELQIVVAQAIFIQRAASLHLTDTQQAYLFGSPPKVTAQFTTGTSEGASGLGAFFLGYILTFIMYMMITLYCVNVMRSVVLEKTSRVMEFMVAAVKPRHLMGGKILGVGGAALIQISVWLAMGGLMLANKDAILGTFGIGGGGSGTGSAFPPLGLDDVAIVIAYFIVGFFFYSSLFAAVGAMVSSEQDTQQVQMPVTMILLVGLLCFQVISNDPRGGSASALTTIPLWSPMLMPMRYVLGGASLGDVAVSLGVLVVSTVIVVRGAAKIYRVGVLMYGKRPSFVEVLRWLRY